MSILTKEERKALWAAIKAPSIFKGSNHLERAMLTIDALEDKLGMSEAQAIVLRERVDELEAEVEVMCEFTQSQTDHSDKIIHILEDRIRQKEEGLPDDVNALSAQLEICEAFGKMNAKERILDRKKIEVLTADLESKTELAKRLETVVDALGYDQANLLKESRKLRDQIKDLTEK